MSHIAVKSVWIKIDKSMIVHKYKTSGKPLCKSKRPKRGFWFVQDNNYRKLAISDELCQKCWDWGEELDKLDTDILLIEANPKLFTQRVRQVLLGYKKPRHKQLATNNIPL